MHFANILRTDAGLATAEGTAATGGAGQAGASCSSELGPSGTAG